jgi:CheY-like chemotaxis protein
MSKKNILICDDDEGIVDVIKIVLEEKGYKTKSVSHGRDIFKIIEKWKPDLVLVDFWMPEISGDEIIKALKKEPHTESIPIILIAAHRRTRELAIQSGADGFLTKPFDIQDLENIVEKHTGGSR